MVQFVVDRNGNLVRSDVDIMNTSGLLTGGSIAAPFGKDVFTKERMMNAFNRPTGSLSAMVFALIGAW